MPLLQSVRACKRMARSYYIDEKDIKKQSQIKRLLKY